jgi:hypothetical protein
MVPDLRRSDHASFWNANLPAIMITDGANFRNNNYHSPADQISTLDLRFMRQVVQATVAAVADMAGIRNATTYWEDTSFPVGLEEGLGCLWQVFPNPAEEFVYVRSENCSLNDVMLRLLDAKGAEVLRSSIDLNEEAVRISVSALPSGAYSLQLQHQERTEIRRIVLE